MYDLHNLGWHSFQQLCLTIARDILGQSVESFLDANDGGRDGAVRRLLESNGPREHQRSLCHPVQVHEAELITSFAPLIFQTNSPRLHDWCVRVAATVMCS